MSWTI